MLQTLLQRHKLLFILFYFPKADYEAHIAVVNELLSIFRCWWTGARFGLREGLIATADKLSIDEAEKLHWSRSHKRFIVEAVEDTNDMQCLWLVRLFLSQPASYWLLRPHLPDCDLTHNQDRHLLHYSLPLRRIISIRSIVHYTMLHNLGHKDTVM